jgi:hypothetical protein
MMAQIGPVAKNRTDRRLNQIGPVAENRTDRRFESTGPVFGNRTGLLSWGGPLDYFTNGLGEICSEPGRNSDSSTSAGWM